MDDVGETADTLNRRHLLRGGGATLMCVVLSNCAPDGSAATSPPVVVPPASPTPTPTPTNAQPRPAGTLAQATVQVTSTALGTIGTGFTGLSYEKAVLKDTLFTPANSPLIALFRLLGPGVLRIGGNSVDSTVWKRDGTGRTAGQVAPADVTQLAGFVRAAGWRCLYGVNLAGSATGTTTPELAADEVAFAANAFGADLLGIEIGNECDIYGHAGRPYAGDWSLARFEALWNEYRTAILARSPQVPITGPASASYVDAWTIPFGKDEGRSAITLLTQHYYRADGALPTSTVASLVTPDGNLLKMLGSLKAGAATIDVPFRISECNSFYNGGASGVSNTYASSLWVLDFLFACAIGGASGFNLHGGGNGPGYTPIANSQGAIVGVRPEYHGLLLFTLVGTGTVLATTLAADGLNLTCYAVRRDAGGYAVVLVNKEVSQDFQVDITLPSGATSATILEVRQLTTGAISPDLAATTGVAIQGAMVGIDGSFMPAAPYSVLVSSGRLTCYVPRLSAILIQTG